MRDKKIFKNFSYKFETNLIGETINNLSKYIKTVYLKDFHTYLSFIKIA